MVNFILGTTRHFFVFCSLFIAVGNILRHTNKINWNQIFDMYCLRKIVAGHNTIFDSFEIEKSVPDDATWWILSLLCESLFKKEEENDQSAFIPYRILSQLSNILIVVAIKKQYT